MAKNFKLVFRSVVTSPLQKNHHAILVDSRVTQLTDLVLTAVPCVSWCILLTHYTDTMPHIILDLELPGQIDLGNDNILNS